MGKIIQMQGTNQCIVKEKVVFYGLKQEDPNQITLFFKYDDKEFYLDTNKDKRILDLIKELNKRYGIPKDSSLYLEGDNELILLEYYNKISQYPKIKNNSKIVVVKN